MDLHAKASEAWARSSLVRTTGGRPPAIYPLAVTRKTEPRLELIARNLEALLKVVQFYNNTTRVQIDGFMLKSLDHWSQASEGLPDEIFSIMSRPCNARCEFCYVRGSPPDSCIQFNSMNRAANQSELNLRLALFEHGRRLFNPTFDREEIITHPDFLDAARRIRQATWRVIAVNTNGFTLTSPFLDELQKLEPIEISISLNAVDPLVRRRLMGDSRHAVLRAMAELDRRRMRFNVTVVPWPSVDWNELEATIRYADSCRPHGIYLILPGYTKFYSEDSLFDLAEYWRAAVERLAPLREQICTPLIVQPRLYEEYVTGRVSPEPRIIGINHGSPADLAGLHTGDVLQSVGNIEIVSQRQALNVLMILRNKGAQEIPCRLRRGPSEIQSILKPWEAYTRGYRYSFPYSDLFGIHLNSAGIAFSDIRSIFRIAEHRGARHVAFATSEIVLPSFIDRLHRWADPATQWECTIHPFIPRNCYYGGTICLGELLTVEDFVLAIRELLALQPTIDLVIIPSQAFNVGGWWRDVRGTPFDRIRQSSPVPVELLVARGFE